MVDRPERYVEELIKLGADGVTIHVEACGCVSDTLAIIQDHGVRAGIALNPETPVREIIPYIDMVDLILVMTVHPGFGGQSYLTGSIDRIKMDDFHIVHIESTNCISTFIRLAKHFLCCY